jgi:hypothetical protein
MNSLLQGVERHLYSPIENMRTLGMIVGENLMNELNEFYLKKFDEQSKKLKFQVSFIFKMHL